MVTTRRRQSSWPQWRRVFKRLSEASRRVVRWRPGGDVEVYDLTPRIHQWDREEALRRGG